MGQAPHGLLRARRQRGVMSCPQYMRTTATQLQSESEVYPEAPDSVNLEAPIA